MSLSLKPVETNTDRIREKISQTKTLETDMQTFRWHLLCCRFSNESHCNKYCVPGFQFCPGYHSPLHSYLFHWCCPKDSTAKNDSWFWGPDCRAPSGKHCAEGFNSKQVFEAPRGPPPPLFLGILLFLIMAVVPTLTALLLSSLNDLQLFFVFLYAL